MTVAPAQLIADLVHAFPRTQLGTGTLDVYLRELDDVPAPVLAEVVSATIRSAEFFPTVRELRTAAAERILGIPTEADALSQIEERTAWAREGFPADGGVPPVYPLVREAIELVGGWHAFRTADNPSIMRAQFTKLYREQRAAALHEAVVGDLGLAAIEASPPLL